MSDLEQALREAMHEAVDGEEAAPDPLLVAVKRRYRRHNLLLAGLVVIIAAAAAIPTAIAVRSMLSQPGPPATRHHVKALPTMMTGLPMPPGTNIRIPIFTYSGSSWYFTATRREERIAGLPSFTAADGIWFRRVQGGWLVSKSRFAGYCRTYSCAGPPHWYSFLADGSVRPTHLGSGIADNGGVPASRPGEVWLVSHARSSDNLATTSADAQLVSTTGRLLSRSYRLPAGYLVVRGVGRYLLLQQQVNFNPSNPPASFPPPAFELWNPSTGRTVRRLNDLLGATGPDQIVIGRECRSCKVQILNVATGTTVTTPVTTLVWREGRQQPAITDDGSLLAMDSPHGVDVISTATGTLTRIPGTNLNFSSWLEFQWQGASHELLVFAGPLHGRDSNPPTWLQVAYWRPGATSLSLTTVRDRAQINAIYRTVSSGPP